MKKARTYFKIFLYIFIMGILVLVSNCNLINKDTCADSTCEEITLYFDPVVSVKKASDLSPASGIGLNCVYSKELCNGSIKNIYKFSGQTDTLGVFINEIVMFKINNKKDKLIFDAVLQGKALKGNNFNTKILTFSEFNHLDTVPVSLNILMD